MASSDYSKYRLLVADDQQSILELVRRITEGRLGCEVLSAHDGDEALAVLEAEPVDVLLTDMMMPGTHGLDLLRQVHARWPEVDIIVMTGYSAEFPYVEVVECGAKDFLNKPFHHAEFHAKLVRLFRERALLQALRLAEAKYRNLFELSAEGMVLLEPETFAITDANAAFRRMSGKANDVLRGERMVSFFNEPDQVRMNQWLLVCKKSGGGTMSDLQMQSAEGQTVYVDVTASFIQSDYQPLILAAFKDVTEKREVEWQLAEAAQKDQLTGLYNKRSFQTRIAWAVKNTQETRSFLSLLLIDLDDFKHCNDTYGHQVGDELLVWVGQTLQKCMRSATSDQAFRFGGDEFAVLLHGADRENSLHVAERIQHEFARNECYGTTLSIGLAMFEDNMPIDRLVRLADEALYQAKGQGKNAVMIAE